MQITAALTTIWCHLYSNHQAKLHFFGVQMRLQCIYLWPQALRTSLTNSSNYDVHILLLDTSGHNTRGPDVTQVYKFFYEEAVLTSS